jgi:hypothetical protein
MNGYLGVGQALIWPDLGAAREGKFGYPQRAAPFGHEQNLTVQCLGASCAIHIVSETAARFTSDRASNAVWGK